MKHLLLATIITITNLNASLDTVENFKTFVPAVAISPEEWYTQYYSQLTDERDKGEIRLWLKRFISHNENIIHLAERIEPMLHFGIDLPIVEEVFYNVSNFTFTLYSTNDACRQALSALLECILIAHKQSVRTLKDFQNAMHLIREILPIAIEQTKMCLLFITEEE